MAGRALLLVCLLLIELSTACSGPAVASKPGRKKLIATGWDSPTPAQFRKYLAVFEKGPFDGTVIRPTRITTDGRTHFAHSSAFSREHWDDSEFEQAITDMKTVVPRTSTDNFLLLNANPGDVDWFDDEGWKEIAEHCRILARVAKEGRLKGIAFDIEPYVPPFQQFRYSSQPKHQEHSFEEYATMARKRGREFMLAMAQEYPDITILAYRLFSDLLTQNHGEGDHNALLAGLGYGLIPAFINGWLDEMPRSIKIIDGNEVSYNYNSEAEFSASYIKIQKGSAMFVAKNNRAKFRRCWHVGQAIYLDAYSNPALSRKYRNPQSGTTIACLEANTASALRASDEYVWIYGEVGTWWPGSTQHPMWVDKLPGVDRALDQAKAVINRGHLN